MIKFGTGGWRAVIGDGFTKENIQILSRAICDKMKKEKVEQDGVVLGYDRRFLSKEAMQWAAQVFAAEGIKAYLINKSAPTPLVMFSRCVSFIEVGGSKRKVDIIMERSKFLQKYLRELHHEDLNLNKLYTNRREKL